MKFATITHNKSTSVALVDTENQKIQTISIDNEPIVAMTWLIENFETAKTSWTLGPEISFNEVTFNAAVPKPRRNIMCVGKNYFEHAQEFTRSGFDSSASSIADAIPKAPIVFTKMPETVVATQTKIGYPNGQCEQLDYEAELGVIIGKPGHCIKKEDAMSHVFGYVIINDLTARDLQAKHKQWFLGKSFETSCPMGPWIETSDELDGSSLDVKCWVNDELRQNANTKDLIFDIPTLIETLSQGSKLLAGDIIATGTPVGVGIGFDPPRFLQSGDEVTIEITGLGALVNVVK